MKKIPLQKNRGFTLMEMLMVIGILSMVGAMSMFLDINSFRGSAFRAEVSALGVAMQTARADALNNINQARHGVAIHPGGYDGYIIFEGNTYATRDASKDVPIKSSYTVNLDASSPTEAVFDQLSGNANVNGPITLVDPNRGMTGVIILNNEGQISF